MTILNIHINEKDKKKIQDITELKSEKSTSEYIRKILNEQIKIHEIAFKEKGSDLMEIPNYIPKNKYIGFVKGAIIAVSDSPGEIAQIAAEKFPNFPLIIKYNGPKKKPMEYCYLNLSELNCWKYVQLEDYSYPILPVNFKAKTLEKKLSASIDTASSLCILKDDLFPSETFTISREEQVSTANGIIEAKIYNCEIIINEKAFEAEFLMAPIADCFPFWLLIGRNLLDQLDTYLFGKKQILCLKLAE